MFHCFRFFSFKDNYTISYGVPIFTVLWYILEQERLKALHNCKLEEWLVKNKLKQHIYNFQLEPRSMEFNLETIE